MCLQMQLQAKLNISLQLKMNFPIEIPALAFESIIINSIKIAFETEVTLKL